MLWLSGCGGYPAVSAREDVSVHRTRVFLAAADYRRAIEESQRHVMERPSALSYVESLAKADRWVAVELLAASPGAGRPEDLLDSPDILARIAKELIQASARKQSDVSAAMAARLDERTVARLWKEQQAWRHHYADSWWLGMPEEWGR